MKGGPDRTVVAGVVAVGAVLLLGGRMGVLAGVAAGGAILFPGVARSCRSNRVAIGAAAGAAVGFLLLGPHPTRLVVAAGVGAAVAQFAVPGARGAAGGAVARVRHAGRTGRGPVRGNHHARTKVVEEVPSGRVGVGRKKGGEGPVQIELCAHPTQRNKLTDIAHRRYCHARWTITSGPTPCPANTDKRPSDHKQHWQLRVARRTPRS